MDKYRCSILTFDKPTCISQNMVQPITIRRLLSQISCICINSVYLIHTGNQSRFITQHTGFYNLHSPVFTLAYIFNANTCLTKMGRCELFIPSQNAQWHVVKLFLVQFFLQKFTTRCPPQCFVAWVGSWKGVSRYLSRTKGAWKVPYLC